MFSDTTENNTFIHMFIYIDKHTFMSLKMGSISYYLTFHSSSSQPIGLHLTLQKSGQINLLEFANLNGFGDLAGDSPINS